MIEIQAVQEGCERAIPGPSARSRYPADDMLVSVYSALPRQLAKTALLAFSIGVILSACARDPIGLVSDIGRYEEIREQFDGSDFVQHFPDSIPTDAAEADLYFVPNLLQGGNILQLRLVIPLDALSEQVERYWVEATHTYSGGSTLVHANSPGGVPTTYFYTSKGDVRAFPASFEVLVLGAEPLGSEDARWNHGRSHGVAIDRASSQIVYWYEDW